MTIPDNRLRFPTTKIDFASDVGLASQDHDNYPPAGGQARFDHLRMVIIALLSNQSSYDEPTQYRDGTLWYDLNTNQLKIRKNASWVSISEAIAVEDEDGITTLADWYNAVSASLGNLAPEISFSGVSTADDITTIGIPISLRSYLYSDSRPFVYKNGLLLDPRNARLEPGAVPTAVSLTGGDQLDSGDEFTIVIRRIPSETWYVPNVSVP